MADEMITMHRQKISLVPDNMPSGSKFTSTEFNTINFVVSKRAAYLDTRTARLNYTLTITKPGATATDPPILPENDPKNTTPGGSDGIACNQYVGSSGLLDTISISTLNGRSLENLRHAGRYYSTVGPMSQNGADYSNSCSDPFLSSKSVSNALVCNQSVDCSVPLKTGVFSNRTINLSDKGTRGLNLSFLLCQNTQMLQPYFKYSPAAPNGTAVTTTGTFTYSVSNVTLTFDALVMSPRMYQELPSSGAMPMLQVQAMQSTLLANDSTTNLRFNTANTLAWTGTFIPSNHETTSTPSGLQVRSWRATANDIIVFGDRPLSVD